MRTTSSSSLAPLTAQNVHVPELQADKEDSSSSTSVEMVQERDSRLSKKTTSVLANQLRAQVAAMQVSSSEAAQQLDDSNSKLMADEDETPSLKKLTRNSESILNLHKMSISLSTPIVHLESAEDILTAIDTLAHNVDLWAKLDDNPITARTKHEIDESDWQTPKRTYQARWDDRITATKTALSNMRGADLRRHKAFAYHVDGAPVGIILITMPRNPAAYKVSPGVYVHDLVTHPGSTACGGELIAQAVAESVQQGQEGMLKLVPENSDADYAYRKLGFTPSEDGDRLELHPTKSDKWELHQSRWELSQYKGKKHIG